MNDNLRTMLERAYKAYKSGDTKTARTLIRQAMQRDPQNADVWYLASLVTGDRDQKAMALNQALKLNSQHKQARAALDALKGQPQPVTTARPIDPPPDGAERISPPDAAASASPSAPTVNQPQPSKVSTPLVLGLVGVVGIAVVVVIAVLIRTRAATPGSPAVLAVLPSDTPTLTSTSTVTPTNTPTRTPTIRAATQLLTPTKIPRTNTPTLTPSPTVNLFSLTPTPLNPAAAELKGQFLVLTTSDLYTVNVDGSNLRNLTHSAQVQKSSARWSPDHAQILIVTNGQVAITNAQGSNAKPVANTDLNDLKIFKAIWSPDGKQIAFSARSADSGNDFFLYVMSADGSKLRPISLKPRAYQNLDWSPDGKAILYTVSLANSVGLWAISPNGGDPQMLASPSDPSDARWSPDGKHIVYKSRPPNISGAQLFVIDADGSNLRKLDKVLGDIASPEWSPDGTQIAYGAQDNSGYGVYVINPNGGNSFRAVGGFSYPLGLEWSSTRDSSQPEYVRLPGPDDAILFVKRTANPFGPSNEGRTELFLLNADGKQQRLTNFFQNVTDPVWSPDRRIAFAAQGRADSRRLFGSGIAPSRIYVMNIDGSHLRQVTRDELEPRGKEFQQSAPSWSPDGRFIAYLRQEDHNTMLYLMNADGTGDHQVGAFTSLTPRVGWSPDSRHLAFYGSSGTIRPGMYMIDVGSSNLRLLTDYPGTQPAWSPDGRTIAFIGQIDYTTPPALFVMDAEGRNPHRVLNEQFTYLTSFSWSPDSAKLVFSAQKGDVITLYRMDADGSNLRALVTDEAANLLPQWAPTLVPQVAQAATATPDPDETAVPTATASPTLAIPTDTPRLQLSTSGLIAFVGGHGDGLCLAKPDGSNVRCTHQTDSAFGIRWSPDGSRFAYVTGGNVAEDIYSLDAQGVISRLTTDSASDTAPAWSPDGKQIAFISTRTGGQIFIMNADGSNQHQITSFSLDRLSLRYGSLAWTPDGKSILFANSPDTGTPGIYAMDPDGSNMRQLNDRWAASLTISPDGKHVAFVSARANTSSIWVMDVDGKNAQQLTFSQGYNADPSWSADGRFLVFSSTRDTSNLAETPHIYIMNADGTDQHRLGSLEGSGPALSLAADTFILPSGDQPTPTPNLNLQGTVVFYHNLMHKIIVYRDGKQFILPVDNKFQVNGDISVSPNGQQIVFTMGLGSASEIWGMNSDGSALRQLTKNKDYDGAPAFSPDGKQIVFASGQNGKTDAYLMTPDGSNLKPLTTGLPLNPRSPMMRWSPDGQLLAFSGLNAAQETTINVLGVRDGKSVMVAIIQGFEGPVIWSPDGQSLYYNTRAKDALTAYRVDLKTHKSQQLGPEYLNPVWSPDGGEILYYNMGDIYLMNVDGSNKRRLTTDSGLDSAPTWSPDGSAVIYQAQQGVAVVNRDGSNGRILFPGPGYAFVFQIFWR